MCHVENWWIWNSKRFIATAEIAIQFCITAAFALSYDSPHDHAGNGVLGISKFGLLTVRRVKCQISRHGAKFRDNQSNHCLDITIYRFLKMASAAILDFF